MFELSCKYGLYFYNLQILLETFLTICSLKPTHSIKLAEILMFYSKKIDTELNSLNL